MTPESRRDQLLAQSVGKEVVVYDERTHAAHRLNPTAALVWQLADGRRTTSELARILHDTIDAPDDEDLVRLALVELDKAGLLLGGLPPINEPITRRRLLQFAAALVPVVASISVPTAQGLCTPQQPGYPNCYPPNNGTYSGTGTPTGINDCELEAGPVSIVLALQPNGSGTLTLSHVMFNVTFTYNNVQASPAASPPNTIRVATTAPVTENGYTTTVDINFTNVLSAPNTFSGVQNVQGAFSCSSTFSMNGSGGPN